MSSLISTPGVSLAAAFRPIGLTAPLGDSRVDQIAQDSPHKNISAANHLGWGNARSGHRLTLAGNFGKSGDRTDQFYARLSAAIASGAGHLYLLGGLNDVAQSAATYVAVAGPYAGVTVSASNVALVAFANLVDMIQQFLAAGGRIVTLCTERGAENLSAVQVANVIELNKRIREYAEVTPSVVVFDTAAACTQPTYSTTAIRFIAGYSRESAGSGVHESTAGAYAVGKDFETHIRANFPPVSFLPINAYEFPSANSQVNLIQNPLFNATTGGGLGAGMSGTAFGNYTVQRISGGSGTQTAVISSGTPADGSPGNEMIIACTFNAAGDIINVTQGAFSGYWAIGDLIQGCAKVTVDSGFTGLASVQLHVNHYDGVSVNYTSYDLLALSNVAIPTNEGYTAVLRTEKLAMVSKAAGSNVVWNLEIVASGAGTATIRVKQAQLHKRFS